MSHTHVYKQQLIGGGMTKQISRAEQFAFYLLENQCTIRACAKHFGISKSTVHLDVSCKLPKVNTLLYQQVKTLLHKNLEQRHIRGGLATKIKYEQERENHRKQKVS